MVGLPGHTPPANYFPSMKEREEEGRKEGSGRKMEGG
jgi:hypothetical protein